MRKGTFFTSNWIIAGTTALLISAMTVCASQQGCMALEFGGLQMTFAPHEDGGIRLSLLKSA